LTLIEGKTFKDYLIQLKANEFLEDELSDMSATQIMREVGSPGVNPEGQFAPQTYFFQQGDSNLDVLKQAHSRLDNVLEQAWQSRSDDVEVKSAYELLILASIIEKETGAAKERIVTKGIYAAKI